MRKLQVAEPLPAPPPALLGRNGFLFYINAMRSVVCIIVGAFDGMPHIGDVQMGTRDVKRIAVHRNAHAPPTQVQMADRHKATVFDANQRPKKLLGFARFDELHGASDEHRPIANT